MKKLSVIMPVYNTKEEYLRESIESVLNQTYKDYDFFIINDGSTNADVAKTIISYQNDKRIKFINNKENRGLISVLNQGLELCKDYKYIARMDSDDISLPTRFEKQIEYLDNDKNVGVLGSWFRMFPENIVIKPAENYKYLDLIKWNPWLCHPSIVLRNSVLIKYNLSYDYNYKYAEDYELWTRMIHITEIHNIQEVLINYRYGEQNTNISILKSKEQQEITKVITDNLWSFLTEDEEKRRFIENRIINNIIEESTVNNIIEESIINDKVESIINDKVGSIINDKVESIINNKIEESIVNNKIEESIEIKEYPFSRYYIRIFGFIPFLKIINKNTKTYYKLLGFIPLLRVDKS